MGSGGAVVDRVRLYSALLAKLAQWSCHTLFRMLMGLPHPQKWGLQQDLSITLMRVLFEVGSYRHWRNFVALMRSQVAVKDLVLTQVPGSTFATPGFRSSWWVSLPPEQQPQQPAGSVVIMYLHGGAFMAGEPLMYQPSYRSWLTGLARAGISARVFAAGYPLAPENPFPRAVVGVGEAYRWLARQAAGDGSSIVLAGDSAGGNLVLTALANLRDQGALLPQQQQQQQQADGGSATSTSTTPAAATEPLQPPLAAVLISPAVDVSASSVFLRQRTNGSEPNGTNDSSSSTDDDGRGGGAVAGDSDPFRFDYVCRSEGESILHEYVGSSDPALLTNPLVSPLYMEDFSGLVQQELLVIAGGCEGMVSDIRRFVGKLKSASGIGSSSSSLPAAAAVAVARGPRVQYHEEPNQPHCCAVLDIAGGVRNGSQVIVPFVAAMVQGRRPV